MALINKFFPRKLHSSQSLNSKSDSCLITNKRPSKQRNVNSTAEKNQRNSLSYSNGETLGITPNHCTAQLVRLLLFRECEVRGRRLLFDSTASGGQQTAKEEFQEIQLMKDMVFGSATLKYSGENYRLHDFSTSPWKGCDLMLSKVFLVPPSSQQPPLKLNNRSSHSGIDKAASSTTDSGYTEQTEGSNGSTCWSSSSLVDNRSGSTSQNSFGSFSLAIPRIPSARKAVSDSLLNNKPSEGCGNRKVRLAVALLFLPSNDHQSQDISVRDIIFEQFSLMDHFVQRLQYGVLRAYASRNHFLTFIHEALFTFEKDLMNIINGLTKTDYPVYLSLSNPQSKSSQVAQTFMTNWESIIKETDTKMTRFFWSSLLSAVLTYHVNWLHSFIGKPVEFFDCGTRVLILSKDSALAKRILHVLSFFIRTSIESVTLAKSAGFTGSTFTPEKLSNHAVFDSTPELKGGLSKGAVQYPPKPEDVASSALLIKGGCDLPRPAVLLTSCRRSSQQLDNNTRYLRNYYDVRFQLSPDTIAKRDGTAFANLISSIAKNDFQDFSLHDHFGSGGATAGEDGCGRPPTVAPCAFFVGSVPDKVNTRDQSPSLRVDDPDSTENTETQPIQVPISSFSSTSTTSAKTHLSRWLYGNDLSVEYIPGRTLQSCDPSLCDWLHDLQLDLRAASTRTKTVSCVVANTETWEIQVLTCVEEEFPSRTKQFWVPVTMSGQVAALVESTQLLWTMTQNAEQCLEHICMRLRFLCRKSEDLGALLSSSIRSWNVETCTRLLGIETQDLPLLMAACSIHSPSVASMGGVTIL